MGDARTRSKMTKEARVAIWEQKGNLFSAESLVEAPPRKVCIIKTGQIAVCTLHA